MRERYVAASIKSFDLSADGIATRHASPSGVNNHGLMDQEVGAIDSQPEGRPDFLGWWEYDCGAWSHLFLTRSQLF